ncbi:hypothetical protein CAAN1_02S05974 [[Candida] anglica]|uniref:Uncharacterized protein n=1 Tax=[Candida] anglica TaxID=148631 RepID=A0ABP0EC72_9ASCO
MQVNTEVVTKYLALCDEYLYQLLDGSTLTKSLITTPTSKHITYTLFVLFVVVFFYETLYWSGIYLGLWEYHAKDIFTEVPVHCAHVYIRLNVVQKDNVSKLESHYSKAQDSFLTRYWTRFTTPKYDFTERSLPITYHFEFSPEDFEMNESPEWGSTIDHLRNKILDTYRESPLKSKGNAKVTSSNVILFNNKYQLIQHKQNNSYLCKCHIETGNLIDAFITV